MPAKEAVGYRHSHEGAKKGLPKKPDSRINFTHGALDIKLSKKGFTTALTFKSPDGIERIQTKRR